jgi:hypothetical protein
MNRSITGLLIWLCVVGCAERPSIGVTISNTPESIESCGSKIGRC